MSGRLLLVLISLIFTAFQAQYSMADITGGESAGRSASDTDCAGTGVANKVQRWCGLIVQTLNDPSSCANKALKNLDGRPIGMLNSVCPGSMLSPSFAVKLALATMERESGGDPKAKGDGGRSQGLFQTTTGDGFVDCKRGDQKDPKTGVKCGLCEMFKPVADAGKLYGGKSGLGKQFGPWRRKSPSQIKLAKKACGSGKGNGSGQGAQVASAAD